MRLSSTKIKDLPKGIRDFLKYLGLDEEKGINEPQPLGSGLKENIKGPIYTDFEKELLTPLNQIIEVYERFLKKQLKLQFKKDQQKFLSRKNFISVIRYLFQVGADSELLYRNAPNNPDQNPLVRAINLRGYEDDENDGLPTLFSTILQYSSFDVNKSFFDEDGCNLDITPLTYMLGFNVNGEFINLDDLEELLSHPDLEINDGQDLIINNIAQVNPDSKMTRTILDYGFNPSQHRIVEESDIAVMGDTICRSSRGSLLNAYNDLIALDDRITSITFQSLNHIFNCGRKIELTLLEKDGSTLFKKCTNASTGNPFLLELCITELKVQALQKWISLQSQSKESNQTKLIAELYSFFSEALGKPSSDTKLDFDHLNAALILDDKVITPVINIIKSSDSAEKIIDIPITRVRDTLISAGFKLDEDITAHQKKQVELKSDDRDPLTIVEYADTQATPMEYAANKGDKFLVQVLLMSKKVRLHEAATGQGFIEAAKKANLSILHLLLTQIPYNEPFEYFKSLLNSKHIYSDPSRQFVVIQCLLEHPIINDNVPNNQLGKLFIEHFKDQPLSSVLFRVIKKRTLKVIKSYTDMDAFRKFVADEFFSGNVNAINDHIWSFLLRPFYTKPILEKSQNPETIDSKEEKKEKTDIKEDEKEEDEDKDFDEQVYSSTTSEKLISMDENDIPSSPQKKSPGEIILNNIVNFFVINDTTTSSRTTTYEDCFHPKFDHQLADFKHRIVNDLDFVKMILDKTFSELEKDTADFGDLIQPLLISIFSNFQAGSENLQHAIEGVKQINMTKLSKYIAKIGGDELTKRDSPDSRYKDHNYFELAILLLKKANTTLNDSDKRLIAMIKFVLGSIHYHRSSHGIAVNSFKSSEEILSSIQSPLLEDKKMQLFTLVLIVRLVSQTQDIVKIEFRGKYLKAMECFRLLAQNQDLPDLLIRRYLDTLEKMDKFQLTALQRSQCKALIEQMRKFKRNTTSSTSTAISNGVSLATSAHALLPAPSMKKLPAEGDQKVSGPTDGPEPP